jgi:hypothetical protein
MGGGTSRLGLAQNFSVTAGSLSVLPKNIMKHHEIMRNQRLKGARLAAIIKPIIRLTITKRSTLMWQETVLRLYRETKAWFANVKITNGSGMEIEFTNPTKPIYRWATTSDVSLRARWLARKTAAKLRSGFELIMKGSAMDVELLKVQTERLAVMGCVLGGKVTAVFGKGNEEFFERVMASRLMK